jgi:hypothetical protein
MANTYFSYFKNVVINDVEIKNIFSKLKFDKTFQNDTLFIDYRISDGDTPETLAKNFYDTTDLFWILTVTNEIRDYYYDWPLRIDEVRDFAKEYVNSLIEDVEDDLITGETLEEKFVEIYGETGETEDDYDTVVDRLVDDKYTAVNAENDLKRDIIYLDPNYLNQFLIEVNKLKPTDG